MKQGDSGEGKRARPIDERGQPGIGWLQQDGPQRDAGWIGENGGLVGHAGRHHQELATVSTEPLRVRTRSGGTVTQVQGGREAPRW